MTKVIIDTNIHISGFGFGGNAAKLISYCYGSDNF
jgi:predicted nucleic acid-binding protein